MIKKIIGFAVIISFLASCKPLNPSIMFKTPKGYEYADLKVEEQEVEYKIAPNDILSFRLFSNNGFRLVDITNNSDGRTQQMRQLNEGITYLVEHDGMVNLPIINRINLNGLTLREAEFLLEEKYSDIYIDPFVMLNFTNRRVTIFPGNGGNGQVITLQNNNVRLLEALALAGGIREDGRAKRVKLIRGDLANPEVYLIDLSTIEGLNKADIILQANDIIYVEPIGVTTRQLLSEISPILGLLSSLVTLYIVLDRL